jgi:hypothetical protein
MTGMVTYAGLDVHARSTHAAAIDVSGSQVLRCAQTARRSGQAWPADGRLSGAERGERLRRRAGVRGHGALPRTMIATLTCCDVDWLSHRRAGATANRRAHSACSSSKRPSSASRSAGILVRSLTRASSASTSGVGRALHERVEHRATRDAEDVRGDAVELDPRVLQDLVQTVGLALTLSDLRLAVAREVPERTDRLRWYEARVQQSRLEQIARGALRTNESDGRAHGNSPRCRQDPHAKLNAGSQAPRQTSVSRRPHKDPPFHPPAGARQRRAWTTKRT